MSTLTQAQAATAELALQVTYRPVSQLKPDPKNARQHGKAQIKKLSRSIGQFGVIMPILVDRGGSAMFPRVALMLPREDDGTGRRLRGLRFALGTFSVPSCLDTFTANAAEARIG